MGNRIVLIEFVFLDFAVSPTAFSTHLTRRTRETRRAGVIAEIDLPLFFAFCALCVFSHSRRMFRGVLCVNLNLRATKHNALSPVHIDIDV